MTGSDSDTSRVYIALLHYPVYNRNRDVVTSAITNLDIHDIARTARTYSLAGFFIVTPDKRQKELAEKIVDHWLEGYGSEYNFSRGSALSLVNVIENIDYAAEELKKEHGALPRIFATTAALPAGLKERLITNRKARDLIGVDNKPAIIVFGTGWGISEDLLNESDYILYPINGSGNYNHLSVRAAAAIIIDRLFGNDL